MHKLEEALRIFLSCALSFLLLFDAGIAYWWCTAPYWNQVQYDNQNTGDIHWNRIAGELTIDCGQLARTNDPKATRALDTDIITLTTLVNLDDVGMPLTTRTCVINVIHQEARR